MMFVELFTPRGSLSAQQRGQIAERLIKAMSEESAPAMVVEAWQAIAQVVFHEPDTWVVGGRQAAPGEPPRYLVRVSVPEAWREAMSAELVTRFTRVLAEAEPDPQRLYQEPLLWIHVLGVPEGSCGTTGQVMRAPDILKLVTRPYREAHKSHAPASVPGSAIDPICGMTVALTDTAITYEHAGATYAFCCEACRELFVGQLATECPSRAGVRA